MSRALSTGDPEFVKVEFTTAAEARAYREKTERTFGVKIPKSAQELELEEREAASG